MPMRDKYGPLFADSDFADLYSWKGAEGLSPGMLATVTIVQYVEGLTDCEAADHVRSRIDWKYVLGQENNDESIAVRFNKHECLACPACTCCTQAHSDARGLHLQPSQTLHSALQEARQYQLSDEFSVRYQARAGIEGTISQAVRTLAMRRTRFIGVAKTKSQNLATATAINLSRLNDWWLGLLPVSTRTSAFLQLKTMLAT